MFSRPKLTVAVSILVVVAVAWWQRETFLAWWHVRQLTGAGEAEREACALRVADLDQAALPRLIAALRQDDETACGNVQAALDVLARRWGPEDARAGAMLERLRREFYALSVPGQAAALASAATLLGEGDAVLPARLTSVAGELLKAAEKNAALRPSTLHLAAALLERVPPGQWRDVCRALAVEGIRDAAVPARIGALRLVLCAALREDEELLARATPLLRDPAPEVRRAAVVSLGALDQLVAEDELLPLLHDADLEVQQLCELALRGRGLQDHHLQMARLISDDSPAARLQVLHHLQRAGDLDPGVWLRRLSHDPAPAVRAAAVRAAAVHPQAELRARLAEMQRHDASPTVRDLARHYLQRPAQ
jgi:hypothetical protein